MAGLAAVARAAVDDLLAADPIRATALGDHRFDDRLPDFSDAGAADLLMRVEDHVTALDGLDDLAMRIDERADLEILRGRLAALRFDVAEVRRRHWDPTLWDVADGISLLLARDFAPAHERLESVIGRLREIPRFLAEARSTLREMSAIHVESAIAGLGGFAHVLEEAGALARGSDDGSDRFPAAAEAALVEVERHGAWLAERLPGSRWDPRLGVRLYSGALWHNLDEEMAPVQVLEAAERHLDHVGESLRDAAAQFLGDSPRSPDVVRRALARLAAESPVTHASVLSVVRAALRRTTEFTRDGDLVTIPDLEVQVVETPAARRGAAVVHCDAPGPLETAPAGIRLVVAPTPAGGPPLSSAYHEVCLHDLTVREAMPGHALQLSHARVSAPRSRVRHFGSSAVFARGWAAYAQQLMADRGYAPDDRPDAVLRLRLQQWTIQARRALDAILDARVHGGDIDEPEALALLVRRGFLNQSEANRTWRRALLAATRLPTSFVGWRAVNGLSEDLRVLHPEWGDRQVHDLVLSHGTLGPRHLRALLGL